MCGFPVDASFLALSEFLAVLSKNAMDPSFSPPVNLMRWLMESRWV